MTTHTSGIDSLIELYDSDIKKITDGPIAWHNRREGARRSIDDHQRALTEEFEKIGLLANVEVWAYSSDGGKSLEDGFMFQVMITGRVNPESAFDFDKMRHEVVSNLLDIPGEGGTIKFDKADFERLKRKHGTPGAHGPHGH